MQTQLVTESSLLFFQKFLSQMFEGVLNTSLLSCTLCNLKGGFLIRLLTLQPSSVLFLHRDFFASILQHFCVSFDSNLCPFYSFLINLDVYSFYTFWLHCQSVEDLYKIKIHLYIHFTTENFGETFKVQSGPLNWNAEKVL